MRLAPFEELREAIDLIVVTPGRKCLQLGNEGVEPRRLVWQEHVAIFDEGELPNHPIDLVRNWPQHHGAEQPILAQILPQVLTRACILDQYLVRLPQLVLRNYTRVPKARRPSYRLSTPISSQHQALDRLDRPDVDA